MIILAAVVGDIVIVGVIWRLIARNRLRAREAEDYERGLAEALATAGLTGEDPFAIPLDVAGPGEPDPGWMGTDSEWLHEPAPDLVHPTPDPAPDLDLTPAPDLDLTPAPAPDLAPAPDPPSADVPTVGEAVAAALARTRLLRDDPGTWVAEHLPEAAPLPVAPPPPTLGPAAPPLSPSLIPAGQAPHSPAAESVSSAA